MPRTPFLYTPSPEYMYVENKVAKDPLEKSPKKGEGESAKAPEPQSDRNHQKEERLQNTIRSLKQEIIKLELQNNRLIANKPSLG